MSFINTVYEYSHCPFSGSYFGFQTVNIDIIVCFSLCFELVLLAFFRFYIICIFRYFSIQCSSLFFLGSVMREFLKDIILCVLKVEKQRNKK